jgi:hypothetical protein
MSSDGASGSGSIGNGTACPNASFCCCIERQTSSAFSPIPFSVTSSRATAIRRSSSSPTARVALSTFGRAPALRDLLIRHGVVDISEGVSLVATSGQNMAHRVRNCLQAIGSPPMAAAAPETHAALGHFPRRNPPRNDPVTPVARILWEAPALAGEDTGLPNETIQAAIQRIAETGWPLNAPQRAAVSYCLGHRLSIVWGPPGTGKTVTAASLVVARILAARDLAQNLRILVTGPTYTAWEKLFGEVLELLEPAHVAGVSCYRVYSSTHLERASLPSTSISVFDIEARFDDPGFQTFWSALQNPQTTILVGAVAHQCYRIGTQGAGKAIVGRFDHLVIDESSQLDVCKSLFPFCVLSAQPEVALFGDHLQMPPVVATQPPFAGNEISGLMSIGFVKPPQRRRITFYAGL